MAWVSRASSHCVPASPRGRRGDADTAWNRAHSFLTDSRMDSSHVFTVVSDFRRAIENDTARIFGQVNTGTRLARAKMNSAASEYRQWFLQDDWIYPNEFMNRTTDCRRALTTLTIRRKTALVAEQYVKIGQFQSRSEVSWRVQRWQDRDGGEIDNGGLGQRLKHWDLPSFDRASFSIK